MHIKKIFLTLSALLMCLCVSGCSFIDRAIVKSGTDNVQKIHTFTTLQEMHAEFGEPEKTIKLSNKKIEAYKLSEKLLRPKYYLIFYTNNDQIYNFIELDKGQYLLWESDWEKALEALEEKRGYIADIKPNLEGKFFISSVGKQVAFENLRNGKALLEPIYEIKNIPSKYDPELTHEIYHSLQINHDLEKYGTFKLNPFQPILVHTGPVELVPNWNKTRKMYNILKNEINLLPFEATQRYDSVLRGYIQNAYNKKVQKAREEGLEITKNKFLELGYTAMDEGWPGLLANAFNPENQFTFYSDTLYEQALSHIEKYKFDYIVSASTNSFDLYNSYIDHTAKQEKDSIVLWYNLKKERYIENAVKNAFYIRRDSNEKNRAEYQEESIKIHNQDLIDNDNQLKEQFDELPNCRVQIDFFSLEIMKSMQEAGDQVTPFASLIVRDNFNDYDSKTILLEALKFYSTARKNIKISSGLKSQTLN